MDAMPRQITNKLSLPEPIYEAVKNDPYTKGEADMSITGLLKPPRIVALEKKFESEIVEDASDRIYSLLGQLMHLLLERANRTGTVEERLYMDLAGWRISGAMDRVVYKDGLLQDYKFVTVYKVRDGVDEEFEKQQNGYAMLLRANGLKVKKIEIVAILRDWSKKEAERNPSYPQHQIVIQSVPIWPLEKTRAFYTDRVRLHQEAKKRLPLCSDEDRWARPEKWAVMVKKQKKALKLHDNEEDAIQHAERIEGYVQHRPGENIRCDSYCAVSHFCLQFQKLSSAKPTRFVKISSTSGRGTKPKKQGRTLK